MNPTHAKTLCFIGLAILGVAQVSCSRGKEGEIIKGFIRGPHRVVTISYSGGTSGPCEVDYPVTFLRVTKHTIAWYAADHDYWVYFDNGSPISRSRTQALLGNLTPSDFDLVT